MGVIVQQEPRPNQSLLQRVLYGDMDMNTRRCCYLAVTWTPLCQTRWGGRWWNKDERVNSVNSMLSYYTTGLSFLAWLGTIRERLTQGKRKRTQHACICGLISSDRLEDTGVQLTSYIFAKHQGEISRRQRICGCHQEADTVWEAKIRLAHTDYTEERVNVLPCRCLQCYLYLYPM